MLLLWPLLYLRFLHLDAVPRQSNRLVLPPVLCHILGCHHTLLFGHRFLGCHHTTTTHPCVYSVPHYTQITTGPSAFCSFIINGLSQISISPPIPTDKKYFKSPKSRFHKPHSPIALQKCTQKPSLETLDLRFSNSLCRRDLGHPML